jgi:molecular chaperone IbpA
MKPFDLSPFWRSTVGFDRLFDLVQETARMAGQDPYPPYNIQRTGDDRYQIALALAGFAPDEITVTAEQNVLTVEGSKVEQGGHEYLYHGIAVRPFRRVFNLADFVQVTGASFEAGLLKIDLAREIPEGMKPRRIPIEFGTPTHQTNQVGHKKAA